MILISIINNPLTPSRPANDVQVDGVGDLEVNESAREAELLKADWAVSAGRAGDSCRSLSQFEAGSRARICSHAPSEAVPERLLELGFVPGTELEVVRRAPFGGPVEVELRGYRICLRPSELQSLCGVDQVGSA
ncbi:MAG: ferrous iron transport protein A [bacterium]|nr:ferrous iron transport protein A [bacterium]